MNEQIPGITPEQHEKGWYTVIHINIERWTLEEIDKLLTLVKQTNKTK